MNVSIKKFKVEMEVKNKGVEFEVRSTTGDHLGDMTVNKAGMIWCGGRTQAKNGKGKTWEEIIDFFNS